MSDNAPPAPRGAGVAPGADLAVATSYFLKRKRTESVIDNIQRRFEVADFEVLGRFSGPGPTVMEAFRRVVHISATPVRRVARHTPGFAERLNEAWVAQARQAGVLADDGSFLVAGNLEYGWLHVRLTDATDILSLEPPDGDLTFIARSMSGHSVCAASSEGAEYWILREDFS
ncbi:hypothetical protein [Streptomyces naphthomycinicus]|uniref:hypothetical protein n=1 Tax=Streptomyces naphthomycinicus TaxID=2872625 RepID=UPI001CEDF12A|nr:hypothetical protein [Streptomyces sp. TML10]